MRNISLLLFAVLLLGLFACFPGQVLAHNGVKVTMVTWRGLTDAEEGFRAGMLGLNRHVSYTHFDARQDRERLKDILGRINKFNTDLVYVFGTIAAKEAKKLVKDVPIVFTVSIFPLESGIMKSENGSGMNIAGVTHNVPIKEQFRAMEEIMRFNKVGAFVNPDEAYWAIADKKLEKLAAREKWELVQEGFSTTDELNDSCRKLINASVEVVFLTSSSILIDRAGTCVQMLNKAGIATLAASEAYVLRYGAFFGLACPYYDVGVKASEIAIQILNGADPGKIPLGRVRPEAVVDLSTAKTLGIKVPEKYLQGKIVE